MNKAPQKLTISKDEILTCYAQGEEAVIVLVESLVARINALEARIEVLENQKSKDSKNSSKPPSGDGFAKRTKSLGKLPAFVNSLVQYGPGLKGLMVYLMEGQLLPSERTKELLQEVIGCEISEATLYNTRLRCYEELAAVSAYIKSGIQVAPVIHFDETGMRVKSKLMWLHVACNGWLTAYFIDPKRGQLAMDAIDILPKFEGVSVHDGLASYGKKVAENRLHLKIY